MKKVFLMLGLVMMTGFVSVNGKNEKIDAHCVITSCRGTICHDHFKDQEKAADYVLMVEKQCDAMR